MMSRTSRRMEEHGGGTPPPRIRRTVTDIGSRRIDHLGWRGD
jgi:hypothetical protein